MAQYRLLYTELLTGDVLGELPVVEVTASKVLNAPGAITATLPLRSVATLKLSDQVQAPTITAEGLAVARTGLYLERDGVIVWGGLLWTVRANVGDERIEIGGEGFLSYFRRRVLRETLEFTAVDQATIASDLIDWAQDQVPSGSIGIDLSDVAATGVLRDRTYLANERKDIGEALEQLAAVDNGFDFDFDSTWSAGAILNRFLVHYPATGRPTDHVFELGTNTSLLDLTIDGTQVANYVDAVGSGEGEDQLIEDAVNTSVMAAYPQLDEVVTFTDVRVAATLQAHADRRLARGIAPVMQVKIETFPDTLPTIGSYQVGDLVRVRGSYGFVDLDRTMRITQWGLSVDSAGADLVTLDLANQEVF